MSGSPQPPDAWVTARHLHVIAARLSRTRHSMELLLAAAGVPAHVLADPDGRVSLEHVEAILAAAARHHADPIMGLHLATEIQPGAFGALGFLFQSASTFGDALEVITRYNRILSNVGAATLTIGEDLATFRWEPVAGGPLFQRHATEYVLGMLGVLTRLVVAGEPRPMHDVSFRHEPPRHPWLLKEYEEHFRCPVHFGKPYSAVRFPLRMLAYEQRFGDPALREVLEKRLEALLAERERAVSPLEATRRAITLALAGGDESKEAVARRLGTSSRSLQRTLAAQGASYRALLDQTRLELAQKRLRESSAPVDEIARSLGFGSHSPFLRWFKRVSGETAGSYRKRSGGEGA